MIDLIRRLEAATEGNVWLDRDIALLGGWTLRAIEGFGHRWFTPDGIRTAFKPDEFPHAYTTSLDAALTLVPEGAGITLERYWIASPETPVWGARILWGLSGDRASTEDRATPALALCTAALKARNEGEGRA